MDLLKLIDGIHIDFTKPLQEETRRLLKLLLNQNDKGLTIHFENKVWQYFHKIDGYYEKIKVTKYDYKAQEILREIEGKLKIQPIMELSSEDDTNYMNLGSIMTVRDFKEKLVIRIIPIIYKYDEDAHIKASEYMYYFEYDKSERIAKVLEDYIHENIRLNDFSLEEVEKSTDVETYDECSTDFATGYSFPTIQLATNLLVEEIKRFEPKLIPNHYYFDNDFIHVFFDIRRQLKYPIYSNPSAFEFVNKFEDTSPEELISFGFHPEKYGVKECFNLYVDLSEKVFLKDLQVISKWDNIKKENFLQLREYYTQINGVTFTLDNKKSLIKLFEEVDEEETVVLKYLMRGVLKENITLDDAIRDVDKLMKVGAMSEWKGRFSKKLIRKLEAAEENQLSKEILESIEGKPTLDNLYRILVERRGAWLIPRKTEEGSNGNR